MYFSYVRPAIAATVQGGRIPGQEEGEHMERSAILGRQILNKVPEITIYFWIVKVLCTTVGETAADFLNTQLNLGLTGTSVVMGSLLILTLVFQFRARRYVPGNYWLAVVLLSVVGTLITDNLVNNFGVPLEVTALVFGVALAATFAAWYASEKTLSIHSIHTTRREAFYWLAILFWSGPLIPDQRASQPFPASAQAASNSTGGR